MLGCSLDELAPQTRRMQMLLDELVNKECKSKGVDREDYLFSRRQVREYSNWSYQQVRVHLERLAELEYLIVREGGRGKSVAYELAYDGKGKEGESFFMGLADSGRLNAANTNPEESESPMTAAESLGTTLSLSPSEGGFVPPLSPHCPPIVGGLLPTLFPSEAAKNKGSQPLDPDLPENAHLENNSASSYRSHAISGVVGR